MKIRAACDIHYWLETIHCFLESQFPFSIFSLPCTASHRTKWADQYTVWEFVLVVQRWWKGIVVVEIGEIRAVFQIH